MEQSQFIALTMNAFQLFRTIVPIDTGNMRYNATRYVQYSDAVEIRVDARTAPYAVYTNEPWRSPRWHGKKNPNEGWVEGGVELIAMYLAQSLGGRVIKE